jgi:uncharacterized protein (DUF1810 family)
LDKSLYLSHSVLNTILTECVKFEVADFDSSYPVIFGQPAITKFMTAPYYVPALTFDDDKFRNYI